MKVTKVSAEAQYSKGLIAQVNGKDQIVSWKKVSLGAEATIDANEDPREAHNTLYAELAAQLKELFTNGPQKTPDKPQGTQDKAQESRKADPSRCSIHNVKMKRREKNGGVWYSHKTKDGWCRGQAQRRGPRK